MLLLQLLVLGPEGVDSVNHLLDELNLGVPEPVLVGDIVGAACGVQVLNGIQSDVRVDQLTVEAAGLSTGSTGLDSQLLAPLLEGIESLLGVAGEVDHDGSPHAGSQVGGAGVDVAVLLGQAEVLAGLSLDGVADSLDAAGQTGEDSLHVTALLHGDDPHLVLLVHPQQEGLGLVVEDATALGPVALHASNLERSKMLPFELLI